MTYPAMAGAAPPALVQAAAGYAGTVANSKAYASNVAATSLLICAVSAASPSLTWTVTDNLNAGNWTAIPGSYQATESLEIFHRTTVAGACTVTATQSTSGSVWGIMLVQEVSGLSLVSPVGVSGSASGSSTAPAVSLAGVTAGDFVYGYCASGTSAVVGSGFTATTNDGQGDQGEYQVSGAGGTVNVAFTQATGVWYATAAAFHAPAVASALPDLVMAPPR